MEDEYDTLDDLRQALWESDHNITFVDTGEQVLRVERDALLRWLADLSKETSLGDHPVPRRR